MLNANKKYDARCYPAKKIYQTKFTCRAVFSANTSDIIHFFVVKQVFTVIFIQNNTNL